MKKGRIIKNFLIAGLVGILTSCSLEEASKVVKDAGDAIADAGNAAGGAIVETWNNAYKGTVDFFDKTGKAIVKYGEPIVDKVVEGTCYAYDNVCHFTQETVKNIQEKSNQFVSDTKDYMIGINDKTKPLELKYNISDQKADKLDYQFDDPYGLNHISSGKEDIESFVTYYISSVIYDYGYEVYNGTAFFKGKFYNGLIFTNNAVTITQGKDEIYTCGFIQLVSPNDTDRLTEEMVLGGVSAVPTYNNSNSAKSGYVIQEFLTIDSFGGIYNNEYFEYHQTDNYVLEVDLYKSLDDADKTIDVYNFDTDKYLYHAEENESEKVNKLHEQNKEAFTGAAITTNAISDIAETAAIDEQVSTVAVIDGNVLSKAEEQGGNKMLDSISNWYQGTIGNNQFISFTDTGVKLLGKDYTINKQRTTNGIISTIGSGLATVGSVATIVFAVSNGSIVISAIVITTGTMATVYNVSNLIAGAQDVYYGSKNSEKESNNPVLQQFIKTIGNEKTATTLYHAWGIGTNIISGLSIPVSNALSIAKCKGLNVFSTFVSVIRASLVTVVKGVSSAIGGALVGNYVSRVVSYVTKEEVMGTLFGFGASLVAGILVYKGLDALDKKLDISGLYPKQQVKKAYEEEQQQKMKHVNDTDLKNLSREEKEYAARKLMEKAADYYGLDDVPNLKIVYDSNTDNLGSYCYGNNTLTVNMCSESGTKWSELADTIGHEMRHYQQYQYAIANPDSDMAYSLTHYITADESYNGYRNQLCEADAWENGAKFSSYILKLFGI